MSQFNNNSSPNGTGSNSQPDPEVIVGAQRRRFSAAYKLRILQEADACQEPGQIGALLRREGLYASHLSEWRQERKSGKLGSVKRGRKADEANPETVALRQQNAQLKAQLSQAELIISAQKKLAQLLEQSLTLSKGMH